MIEAIEKTKEFLRSQPVLYAATMGLDKKPNVHPIELCYESEGALYFAAAKCEVFYGELSIYPFVKICVYDAENGILLNLVGKAVFTEDEGVVSKCISECRSLREAWGQDPKMVIAWFLRDAVCEFINVKDGTKQVFELGTPQNALIGIQIKKKKELQDRLIAIMAEREREAMNAENDQDPFIQKLYDGAVLYFAEAFKQIWPRMDIRPIERCACFDTYDERERFTALAKKIIGNAVIGKPEDMTYWLNKETLESRLPEN